VTTYVVVSPAGSVTPSEQPLSQGVMVATLGPDSTGIDFMEGRVYFNPALNTSGAYNWQATRLLRDRLLPDDRIFGDVIVTGPAGGPPAPELLVTLRERWMARQ
jgi:hypothetical protein